MPTLLSALLASTSTPSRTTVTWGCHENREQDFEEPDEAEGGLKYYSTTLNSKTRQQGYQEEPRHFQNDLGISGKT